MSEQAENKPPDFVQLWRDWVTQSERQFSAFFNDSMNSEAFARTMGGQVEMYATFQRMLADDSFGFLVAKLEPGRHPWTEEQQKPTDGVEDKYQFLRYVEKLEGRIIHSGIGRH